MDKLKKVKEALEYYASEPYNGPLQAKEALAELNEFMDWPKPIETAPEKEEVIVFYLHETPQIDGAKYGMLLAVYRPKNCLGYDTEGWYTDLEENGRQIYEPTHWMPKPEPPPD